MHSFLLIPKQQIAMPPSHGRDISKLRANHLPPRSEGGGSAVQLDCSLKRDPGRGLERHMPRRCTEDGKTNSSFLNEFFLLEKFAFLVSSAMMPTLGRFNNTREERLHY